MRRLLRVLALSLLILSSCSKHQDKIVIFKEFQNNEWSRFDYLHGNLNIKNAPVKYDVIMEIVVNDDYPNLYENHQKDSSFPFNLTIKNPDNNGSRSKDYKFTLKDEDGNWKSDKKNGCYTYRLPIINEMSFSEDGDYEFKIENKYTKDPMYGIKSLTLKCISSK